MTKHISGWLCAALAAAALAGCASSSGRAPVSELGAAGKKHVAPISETRHVRKYVRSENDPRPQTYAVQKGDTLYGIAFNYGLDYHEIAEINNIQDPYVIHERQELRLFPNVPGAVAPRVVENKPQGIPVKDQPKVAKLPYSEQAVAEIQQMQETQHKSEPVIVVKVESKPEPKPETVQEAVSDSAVDDDTLEWGMPTNGKVIGEFSESANRKGVDISGKLGQAVMASAAGKVVYSGSGLRGYGKLVIIKHNNTFLSAYAHNDQVLVKEGQTVSKGQKIAEMGSTDSDQVKLHFEIRKFGKPVDPAKYLPLVKS
jgi:lipoprotein NlpD